METQFKWLKSPERIIEDRTGGKNGLLFLANEARRLMEPYVPAQNMVLSSNVNVTVQGDMGIVEYRSPYAHYQYTGTVYVSSKTGSAWSSGEYKVPTSRSLQYSKFRHPLATKEWDKAMKTARMDDLTQSFQKYLGGH